jgi:hypothetical protein
VIASAFPESSCLARVTFQPALSQLIIEFRNGSRYRFDEVPSTIFTNLLAAISKGAFFNRHIRDVFPSTRLPDSIAI